MNRDVLAAIDGYQMVRPGELVLCALSGGADSAAMTDWLWRQRQRLGIRVAAAHFIHGLRPGDAGRERELVEDFCRARQIPLQVGQGDTRAYCSRHGCGEEEGARALRYAFLQQCADALGAQRIATAHHLEDNAETVLLNLCRGTGLNGLGGIPPVRGRLIRPMLFVTRDEIEKYLAQNHIRYVEDPSNGDESYARNRLRHRVTPQLRAINTQALRHIADAAASARQDAAYLDQVAQDFAEDKGRGGFMAADELAGAAPAIALRAVQLLYRQAGGATVLTAAQRRAVLALCTGGPSGRVDLPQGIVARRVYEALRFEKPAARQVPPPQQELQAGAWVRWGAYAIALDPAEEAAGRVYRFAADALAPPLTVRARREGDSILLRGHHRSIKKWMIEQKIPAHLRGVIPLVCDKKGVVLIAGGPGRDSPAQGTVRLVVRKNDRE